MQTGTCRFAGADGEIRYADFRAKADFWPGLHVSILRDVTEQHALEAALRDSNRHLLLLFRATSQLLAADQPRELIQNLFRELSGELGLELYFNFIVAENGQRLHLDSYAGVTPDIANRIEWLDFGEAVCGTVARNRETVAVEDVQSSTEPMTALIRELGVQAYVCNPLLHGGKLIGTLSFGTRNRSKFRMSELQLMKSVAENIAIHRRQLTAEL